MTDVTSSAYADRSRTLTAFFDDRASAERARDRLVNAGIEPTEIRLVDGSSSATRSEEHRNLGFWESLKELFIPDEDRHAYAEGIRRGGFVLAVTPDEATYNEALDILDDEGSVDLDERASEWRSTGWTGYSRSGDDATGGVADASTGSSPSISPSGDEEVIPVVQEELRVGKRDVSHGRVRVRSYVVETPVEEEVQLREERVRVERRPVDRPLADTDEAFQERVIEVDQRAEEPVVSKQARVTEEVVIGKDVDQRTERVEDTVKRTEVQVDDDRKMSRKGDGTSRP